MSENQVKVKKSVALSGVSAGTTALSTVGSRGDDLHYRGYDILDLATRCEFEEVAHLLIHGRLPDSQGLKAYRTRLKALRGLPAAVKAVLEALPASQHPMDRSLGPRVQSAGKRRPQSRRYTRPGRQGHGLHEFHAPLLVSLRNKWQADRGGN